MGAANTQCQLLQISARKSDMEYRLLTITNTIQRMSAQSASLHEEMLTEVKNLYNFNSTQTGEDEETQVDIDAFASGEFYTAYQTQLALINSKETILDVEKTQCETQIQALSTLEESLDKQLENDLKNSVMQV